MIFGLTGGICCGKSTAEKTLVQAGVPVVDADIIARQVVEPGTEGLKQIVERFGSQVLLPDGTLDRPGLGAIVFPDEQARTDLNRIMLPIIVEAAVFQFRKFQIAQYPVICYSAALIIENGAADLYRPLVVLHCPVEEQLRRLMQRNSLTEEQAMARINAQLPTSEKLRVADYAVDTSGPVEETQQQVLSVLKSITEKLHETGG